MKNITITLFFFFFGFINSFACDCDTPKAILEFYSSKYVFKGIITEKTFSKDSATYTIKFKVLESYKKGKIPKQLSFKFSYKEDVEWSVCYSTVYQNQEWLVFAYETNGVLGFSKMCSNSRFIGSTGIEPNTQKILDNGSNFKLDDYIYGNDWDIREEFNFPKPITDIDSIFKSGKIKKYERTYGGFKLFINRKGELISVFSFLDWDYSYGEFKYDPVFNLLKEFNVKSKRPLNEFEIDAMELLKSVKVWEIKRNKKTQVAVDYTAHVNVEFDEKNMKWSYDLR
jgi:hypothetical protein